MVNSVKNNGDHAGTWLQGKLAEQQRADAGGTQRSSRYTQENGLTALPGVAGDRNVTHYDNGSTKVVLGDGTEFYRTSPEKRFIKLDEGDLDGLAASYVAMVSNNPTELRGAPDEVRGSARRDAAAIATYIDEPRREPSSSKGTRGRAPGPSRPGRETPVNERMGTMRGSESTELLKSFEGEERYPGQKLVEKFLVLFDTTAPMPTSLAQAGLCVVAVKTSKDEAKMPAHASYMGKKLIDGNQEVSLFVVGADEIRELSRDLGRKKLIFNLYEHDGIYALSHSGGVGLYGPGMDFVNALKYDKQAQVDSAQGGLHTRIKGGLGTKKLPVQLDEASQGRPRNVELLVQEASKTKAFMATFNLSPAFGNDEQEIIILRQIGMEWARIAKLNSCLPIISGNSFTIVTNLHDETALESPEDVALAVESMNQLLLDYSSQNPTLKFEGRMYQTEVEVHDGVVDGWAKHQYEMKPTTTFDNTIFADGNYAKFDSRTDARNRFVNMQFTGVDGSSELLRLKNIASIRDKVAAGQIVEFVGRDDELRKMADILEASEAGLQTVLVKGPTGAGKTALILRVAATNSEVGATNTVVLAFKNKDNLAALADLARGVLDVLATTNVEMPGQVNADVKYLKQFIGEIDRIGFSYTEAGMISAVSNCFKLVSKKMVATGKKFMLVLDDFDAAGSRMRSVVELLLASLNEIQAELKGMNVFGTIRSAQDHAGANMADRGYVDNVESALGGNKLDINEFVLRQGDTYAPWLGEFLQKRCLGEGYDIAKPVDPISLAYIAELCALMASRGAELSHEKTEVSAHTLRLIVDELQIRGYLTVDKDTGGITCTPDQYQAAHAAINDEELPCGPEDIYRSQLARAKNDMSKMQVIYFAEIMSGVDYRVLEDSEIANFLGSELLADDSQFTPQLDALRMRHDGSGVDGAMLSAGSELDMHGLWRREVVKDMKTLKTETLQHLKKTALDALIMAKDKPALAGLVEAVMVFELANALGETGLAKEWSLKAAEEAVEAHDYQKAIECAEFAEGAYEGDDQNTTIARFYLAKAYLYAHDSEKGRPFLMGVIQNIMQLPLEMRVELVEIQLESFKLDVVSAESKTTNYRNGVLEETLASYQEAIKGKKAFIDNMRSRGDGDVEVANATNMAELIVQHHNLEYLYKFAVLNGITKKQKDVDSLYEEVIHRCENFLETLHQAPASDKVDVMLAKASQLLSAVILQRNREKVAFDETLLMIDVAQDPELKKTFARMVEICDRALLIARQKGGLGGDYEIEARAAVARFYAATFLDLDANQLAHFASVAAQYLANVSKVSAESNMGNIYCGAAANVLRTDISSDVQKLLLDLVVSIAKFQCPKVEEGSKDTPSWYRYYNYVESLLINAAHLDGDDAKRALETSYNLLDKVLQDAQQPILAATLVGRHAVLSHAKGVVNGFDYGRVLTDRNIDLDSLILEGNTAMEESPSDVERQLFAGLGKGVSEIEGINDLFVQFGVIPALQYLKSVTN